jgi:hypothetical protein
MEKPSPKTEVAVRFATEGPRGIALDASPDAIEDFREFGHIDHISICYWLVVDSRYDFDEVLAYIEQYGEDE